VVVCDPDGDGWPDLVVANDTVRNFFFHNVPGGRRRAAFEEIGLLANVAYAEGRPRGAMGIDWGEYMPGQHAVVIANFSNEPNTLLQPARPEAHRGSPTPPWPFGWPGRAGSDEVRGVLLRLRPRRPARPAHRNGHLEPEIAACSPARPTPSRRSCSGTPASRNRLFEPVTDEQAGPDLFKPIVGRGCAYLDYDGDGDLDVVRDENGGPARLLRNDNATGNNWVAFALVGNGTTTNRDAIGAEITVEAGGRVQRQYVTTARGYLSQSDLVATFGLGPATVADRVTVRWPGKAGDEQTWTNLPVGKRHELVQANP
jgi:enediyne biosynthesis protein E4